MGTQTEIRNAEPVHIAQVIDKIIKDIDPNRLREIQSMKAHNKKINIKIGMLMEKQRTALLAQDFDYANVLERDMDCMAEDRYILDEEYDRVD